MDETGPVRDIEAPREEGNAGIGFAAAAAVVDEPELIAGGRRVARDFLGLGGGVVDP